MNPDVDRLIADDPRWSNELQRLRALALDRGLSEQVKWRQACYVVDGGNVAILNSFRDYCALSFFKGALLEDPRGLLTAPGKNSQATRQFRFTSVEEIDEREMEIVAFLDATIANEKAGRQIEFRAKDSLDFPAELEQAMDADESFREAFLGLTPGRQRAYVLHFGGAKQSATRISRIEKCRPQILEGRGLNDR